jgi:hypothetical protein
MGSEVQKPATRRGRGRPRKRQEKDKAYGSSNDEHSSHEAESDEAEEQSSEESEPEDSSAESENDRDADSVSKGDAQENGQMEERKPQLSDLVAAAIARPLPVAATARASDALVEVDVDHVAEFLFLSESREGGGSARLDHMDTEEATLSTIGRVTFLEETKEEKQRREARERGSGGLRRRSMDGVAADASSSAIEELLGDTVLLDRVSEALAEGLRQRGERDRADHTSAHFIDTIVRESERLDQQVSALRNQQRAFGDLLCAMLGRDRRRDREAAREREAETLRQEVRARIEAEAEAVRQRTRADEATLVLANERQNARQQQELLDKAHHEMERMRDELARLQRAGGLTPHNAHCSPIPHEEADDQPDHQQHEEEQSHDGQDAADAGGSNGSAAVPTSSSVEFIEFI